MDHDHVWDAPLEAVADKGPLEGEWVIEDCVMCAAFRLQRADGEDPTPNLLALN